MEGSGEAEKVNIRGYTYQKMKNKFNCEFRAEIESNGSGKVNIYFIEGNS
jgi:hypothetical protein